MPEGKRPSDTRLSLDELLAFKCPQHGASCGRLPDPEALYVNGRPGRYVEVFCAYRLNAAFGVPVATPYPRASFRSRP